MKLEQKCNQLTNMKHLRKNKHAPLKKKFIRANHVPYMTKNLRKVIMKRSQLENKYIRNSTVENMNKYKKQKFL